VLVLQQCRDAGDVRARHGGARDDVEACSPRVALALCQGRLARPRRGCSRPAR
jgi:hypothetical protein